jgi:transcriptional regulator with XRE-family HTH domain
LTQNKTGDIIVLWRRTIGGDTVFGERIREIRKKQGMSLNKLSKESEVAQGYLSDLENNKTTNPSLETLNKISKSLGVSLSELVSTNDIDINDFANNETLNPEIMWGYLINAAENDPQLKKVLAPVFNKREGTSLTNMVVEIETKKGPQLFKYDFANKTVSRHDEVIIKEKPTLYKTLAAHMDDKDDSISPRDDEERALIEAVIKAHRDNKQKKGE